MTRERRQHIIEMIVRAREPIAHGKETIGNMQIANRAKVCLPNGRSELVPIISGNSIRHGLREAGTDALRDAAGLRGGLTEAALQVLYNGGTMRGTAKDSISIEESRELEELVPHLALLGGCVGNRIVEGKTESGYGWLICRETVHILPQWVADWITEQGVQISSAREHVEVVQNVRFDPTLSPKHRQLLSPEALASVEQRLLVSDTASARGDAKLKRKAKSSMMPFSFETIIAGSLFYWRFVARTDTDIERDALFVSLAAFFAHGKVGGKRGTGHGGIEPVFVRGHEAIVSAQTRGDELAIAGKQTHAAWERFKAHVGERVDRIERWLREVEA